jgi:hypothetical protein
MRDESAMILIGSFMLNRHSFILHPSAFILAFAILLLLLNSCSLSES